MANCFGWPDLGIGIGIRGPHVPQLLRQVPPQVQWLEAITENYLVNRGFLRKALLRLSEQRPVVLHGVSLNIGSSDPLDADYLRQIKRLASDIAAPWVSDHLCWTGVGGRTTHDLLPVPYTEAMLAWIVARIGAVQDALGRPLVLENPSSYMAFKLSDLSEWQFVREMAQRSGCGLLVDVNNVAVSAHNHGFAEQDWLDAVPWSQVCQLHVAGHTVLPTHWLDTHIGPVSQAVWRLYGLAHARAGGCATLLEWDDAIPPLAAVVQEAAKALQHQQAPSHAATAPAQLPPLPSSPPSAEFAAMQRAQTAIFAAKAPAATLRDVLPSATMRPRDRLLVHARMYRLRLRQALEEDFPRTLQLAGRRASRWMDTYLAARPPCHWALELYGEDFAAFAAQRSRALGEVAALEWARVRCKLAPFADPVRPDAVAALGPRIGEALVQFAGHATVLQLPASAWQLVAPDLPRRRGLVAVRLSQKGNGVAMAAMHPAEAALWRALAAGQTLAAACATVAAKRSWAAELQSRVGQWLQAWVQDGAVCRLAVAKPIR